MCTASRHGAWGSSRHWTPPRAVDSRKSDGARVLLASAILGFASGPLSLTSNSVQASNIFERATRDARKKRPGLSRPLFGSALDQHWVSLRAKLASSKAAPCCTIGDLTQDERFCAGHRTRPTRDQTMMIASRACNSRQTQASEVQLLHAPCSCLVDSPRLLPLLMPF